MRGSFQRPAKIDTGVKFGSCSEKAGAGVLAVLVTEGSYDALGSNLQLLAFVRFYDPKQ